MYESNLGCYMGSSAESAERSSSRNETPIYALNVKNWVAAFLNSKGGEKGPEFLLPRWANQRFHK